MNICNSKSCIVVDIMFHHRGLTDVGRAFAYLLAKVSQLSPSPIIV